MAILNWKVSKEDADLIAAIVRRALNDLRLVPMTEGTPLRLSMDITACHNHGCPLDLRGLLEADDFNFCHDIGGIVRHINRQTGELRDCFVPRYTT